MKMLWFCYVYLKIMISEVLQFLFFILNSILNFTFNICSLDSRTNLQLKLHLKLVLLYEPNQLHIYVL